MKTTIIFNAISLNGQPVEIEKEMVCPDFKVEKSNIKQFLIENSHVPKDKVDQLPNLPDITIESQIIDWLDDRDNMGIIYEYDLGFIIDYKVKNVSDNNNKLIISYSKEEEHVAMLKVIFKDSPQMLLDYAVIFKEMKKNIKHLTFEEQFKIVMNSMGVASEAKIAAYKHIHDLIKSTTPNEMMEKIRIKYRDNRLLDE